MGQPSQLTYPLPHPPPSNNHFTRKKHTGMKAEMDALARNMEGIAGRMQVVNAFLAGKRAKVRRTEGRLIVWW